MRFSFALDKFDLEFNEEASVVIGSLIFLYAAQYTMKQENVHS